MIECQDCKKASISITVTKKYVFISLDGRNLPDFTGQLSGDPDSIEFKVYCAECSKELWVPDIYKLFGFKDRV